MKLRMLAVLAAFLLAACSKVTQENYARIKEGMSEKEVVAILGSPSEASSGSGLRISGTTLTWKGGDAVITVRLLNGKVALKSYDKPGAAK